jgi:uncharacterized repeat protein (TIGR04138 family)
MQKISIEQAIEQLTRTDPRYPKDAYHFVREALDFTIKQHKKKTAAGNREHHICGKDLLEGIRVFALKEYGPLTHTVLNYWNLKRSEDIGEVVYNLVSIRVLKTSDTDSKDDFNRGYDFKEAFIHPFEPSHSKKIGTRSSINQGKV